MLKIFWLENLKGSKHSEDLDVDEMITLEWMLGKILGMCGVHESGSEQESVSRSCE
jgi:hypothetical protein